MVYIGIDLGTTYSCVAIVENDRPVVIKNDDGWNTLPSVVAFNNGEILVGNPALNCGTDMGNILYDSKRLIGWQVLHDLPIAEDHQLWTFNADIKNNCAGYILNKGTLNERFIRPEEVSAEILKSLKACAEKYTNQKVIEAVVTVPAMFNSDQIAATKKAIELAGLKLKCLLQEPMAAAIAYNEKKQLGNSKLLVFDLGEGTLDISIVEIKNEHFDVKAITSDAHFGGQDFDSRVMKFVIDEFKKSSPDYDIYKKPKLLKRLRIECRKAKELLSSSEYPVDVHLDINDDLEINVRLTKEKFNELCNDLFERAIKFIDRALNMAQLLPEEVDHVILVGGSTRIPQIKQKIMNKFGNSKIQFDINPDKAIAYGAAIVANSNKKQYTFSLSNLLDLFKWDNTTQYNGLMIKNRPMEHFRRQGKEMHKRMASIGIDLGTTYSCVAIVEDGRPVAIHNDDGKNIVPSVVAFTEKEILVGNSALDSDTDLPNILYDSKRLIGWHVLNDLPIADDRHLWTFNAETRNKRAGYILNKGTRDERFMTPEEVSAEILKSLKSQAEKYLKKQVIEAIVTVPAMFHFEQIAATKKAIELAGLELKCLLQEPMAAAIAYNEKKQLGNSKLLIFDLGGGTLDISIVEIKNENFEVKAITGDAHLGGQDFDSRIMKFVIDEFKRSSPGYDIYKRPRLLKRLRIECRKAKESLSSSQYPVNVHLDINDKYEINVILTKEKFYGLCCDLFERAMKLIDRALNMAQLSPDKIDHVILVGGSTRIPQIGQNIKNKFSNSKIQFDINPDEAIAHGAAIVANENNKTAILVNHSINGLQKKFEEKLAINPKND